MSIEVLYFVIMIAAFFLCAFFVKLPVSLSMVVASVGGIVLLGETDILRHLIEGSFGYFDTLVVIATAIIFMKVVEEAGTLEALSTFLISKFYKIPSLLLVLLVFLVMIPGALTGSATISVLTMGSIVAPVFMAMGVPRVNTAAIVAMGGIAGMAAPPVNLPVMIINAGIDMPYIGFGLPLTVLAIPPAIFAVLWLGLRHVGGLDYNKIKEHLNQDLLREYGYKIYTPFMVLIILMLLPRLFPGKVVDIGLPLSFLIAAAVGMFSGRKLSVFSLLRHSTKTALPVMGILIGVGMFIQVMTLNGVRGLIVTSVLSLPSLLLYVGIAVSLPLFGAVSSYGAASVLGVPFALAFLGYNELIVVGAISLVSGLGDLTPPTALAGIFAAQVLQLDDYKPVLKKCLLPALFFLLYGMAFIIFSRHLGFLI